MPTTAKWARPTAFAIIFTASCLHAVVAIHEQQFPPTLTLRRTGRHAGVRLSYSGGASLLAY